jgi:CheY-like chemotaxis protein
MTKILLVEDDKSLREIYGVRLLAEGYDIVSAGDGEEALAMAIKDRPELIVSDVMMPKISGFDMLDILRSTTETKNIKVIMMTALSSEDQRQRGVALGADRYLVKSQVGIEDVVRTVHEVLGDAPIPGGSAPTPSTAAPAPAAPSAPVENTPPAPAPSFAQPTAAPSPLPQPTAPFSTPRPANLGDRVIQPLVSNEPKRDFSNMMSDELSSHEAAASLAPPPSTTPAAMPTPAPVTAPTQDFTPSPEPPAAPQAPFSPMPAAAPQPQPSPASAPLPPTPLAVPSAPPMPPMPPAPDTGLNFEETPRPVQNPAGNAPTGL